MSVHDRIRDVILENIALKQKMLSEGDLLTGIAQVCEVCSLALSNGHKLLFCGNGGSAADAQHIAAELTGRFYLDRQPFHAEALHVNTSYLTAVANDYSFDAIYQRQVEAKGQDGDVLFGISTSGNSENVLRALVAGRAKGLITVGLTGGNGGKMSGLCDHLLCVPSSDTPRIQEAHIMIGHMLCEVIERNLAC